MARYSRNSYARRKKNPLAGWFYTFLLLVLIVILVALVFDYNPFESNTDQPASGDDTPTQPVPKATHVPTKEPVGHPTPEPLPEPVNVAKPEPEPTPENVKLLPNPQVRKLIDQAVKMRASDPPRIIEARDTLNKALPIAVDSANIAFIKEQLSELAEVWLFSRTIFPNDKLTGSYQVKSGDLLSKIGKEHKVPFEILMHINKISRPELLRAGDNIKIVNGPFHAKVYRSTFTLDMYLQDTFVRSFPVGLGKAGYETPTGEWLVKVGGKMEKPTWTDPDTGVTYESEDPNYPLGSRWIALKGLKGEAKDRTGFAIHGTNVPDQIGTAGSRGCIRMHNGEAKLVYNLMCEGYSKIWVYK